MSRVGPLDARTRDLRRAQSYLSATIGSTRDARRAGRKPASAETAIITAVAATIVSASVGARPKSRVETKRPAPSEPATPMRDADRDEHHRLAQHLPQHVAALRAERHADADLVGAARHGVRHQPEQPDRRDQQRQPAEQRVGLREQSSPARSAARPVRAASRRPSSAGSDRPGGPPRGRPPVTLDRIAGGPHLDHRRCRRASAGTARTSSAAPDRARCCIWRRAARRRSRAGRWSRRSSRSAGRSGSRWGSTSSPPPR